jgi:hypothetical protein
MQWTLHYLLITFLFSQYIFSIILFVVNKRHLFDTNNAIHTYNTRNNNNLHQVLSNLAKVDKGPYISGIRAYNHLPQYLGVLVPMYDIWKVNKIEIEIPLTDEKWTVIPCEDFHLNILWKLAGVWSWIVTYSRTHMIWNLCVPTKTFNKETSNGNCLYLGITIQIKNHSSKQTIHSLKSYVCGGQNMANIQITQLFKFNQSINLF